MIERLAHGKSVPFIVNDVATTMNVGWRKARTAVDRAMSLGLLAVEGQTDQGYTVYVKSKTFKSRFNLLHKQGVL